MREILFRGKVKECNEWVYGSLIYIPNEYCCIMDNNCDDEDLPYTNNDYGTFDGSMTPIDKDTIGQFTGRSDKNGTKIFEGDIVKGTITSAWAKQEIVCVVKYLGDAFVSIEDNKWEHSLMFAKNIEVIGNIHDNPELLGESDDISR